MVTVIDINVYLSMCRKAARPVLEEVIVDNTNVELPFFGPCLMLLVVHMVHKR